MVLFFMYPPSQPSRLKMREQHGRNVGKVCQEKFSVVQLSAGQQYFLHGLRRFEVPQIDHVRRPVPQHPENI